ncbi:MAG TPA: hypothetical protein VFH67_06535, partial [bacterium]|nr:hypothetical protein [bacterium]
MDELPSSIDPGDLELHGAQRELYQALVARDASRAEIYVGALHALASARNPDRLAQCAHSLRELIERLPESVDIAVAPLPQLSSKVDGVEHLMAEARRSRTYREGAWEGTIDEPLRAFILSVEELTAWRTNARERRRQVTRETLTVLPGAERVLPDPLIDAVVDDWMQAHRYFTGVSHHKPTGEQEFAD